MIEALCYTLIGALTVVNYFVALPIQLNITCFSMAIIIAGSNRSLQQMINTLKTVHIDKKKAQGVETLTKEDAMQFPLYAGGMLCGLYGLIKYFGKEIVNPLLLGYMGIGASQSIKGLVLSLSIGTNLDKKKLIKCKIEKIGLDLEVSPLDLICLVLAYMAVGVYIYSKNWIYNNVLALLFCVHGIEFLFLGNFTTGFILLGLLFFYDIFFVFGTDVMLTVAKSIDAPIKLLFPKDWEANPP